MFYRERSAYASAGRVALTPLFFQLLGFGTTAVAEGAAPTSGSSAVQQQFAGIAVLIQLGLNDSLRVVPQTLIMKNPEGGAANQDGNQLSCSSVQEIVKKILSTYLELSPEQIQRQPKELKCKKLPFAASFL